MTERKALSDGAGVAVNLPAIEPGAYAELMSKALVAALRYLPAAWPDGWLTLDPRGRRYLEEEGISEIGLWLAVNEGVRAGLIWRRVKAGFPCVALREKVEGRR